MADAKTDESKDENLSDWKSKSEEIKVDKRAEYFEKLEKWLQEAYAWQSVAATIPYYLMSSQLVNPSAGILPFVSPVSTLSTNSQQLTGNTDQQTESLRQRRTQESVGSIDSPLQNPAPEGFEYRIPPIWKRFVAEFIDSTMLFFLKLTITLIAVDHFGIIYLEDLDLLSIDLRTGYKMTLEMTYGLLMLEITYRIIVCIFEAFCLQHGVDGHSGTTPGKLMMGLRVVQCRTVTPVERPNDPDLVLVSPGTDLDLFLTLKRSVVKSLMLVSFFPICFDILFFRFNRTGYDVVCNSIVVEDPYRNRNNNRQRRN